MLSYNSELVIKVNYCLKKSNYFILKKHIIYTEENIYRNLLFSSEYNGIYTRKFAEIYSKIVI